MTVFELEQCIEEHGTAIYSFCQYLTGTREQADELYQDTFLVAVEHIRQLHNDGDANPKSFLLSVAVRLWKNRRRKAAWRRRIAPEQSLDVPGADALAEQATAAELVETEILRQERRLEVRRAVGKKKKKYRVVVLLFYMEELSVEELARVLQVPAGTVKSRLHHARRLLKNQLEVLLYE